MRLRGIKPDRVPYEQRPQRHADCAEKQAEQEKKSETAPQNKARKISADRRQQQSQRVEQLLVTPKMNRPTAADLAFDARLETFAAEFLDQRRREKRRNHRKSFVRSERIDLSRIFENGSTPRARIGRTSSVLNLRAPLASFLPTIQTETGQRDERRWTKTPQ